jgi:O-methyltransferase involved in polyketide biosynthesis
MGSGIVFDYMILPSLLSPMGKRAFDSLSNHVAQAGEPFQSFFDPSNLKDRLLAMGFQYVENIEPEEMNARYFIGRRDELKTGSLAHVMNAIV